MVQKRNPASRNCLYCGEGLTERRGGKRFCNRNHRERFERTVRCVCGARVRRNVLIRGGWRKKFYCSRKCKDRGRQRGKHIVDWRIKRGWDRRKRRLAWKENAGKVMGIYKF